MTVFAWARNAADNAVQSVGGFKLTDLLPFRIFPAVAREIMAQMRRYADDQGGALVTGGRANGYTVQTGSGIGELRAGLSLLVRVDRDNTDAPTLSVDGLGPIAWIDANGEAMPPGRLAKGCFYRIVFDAVLEAWRLEFVPILGGVHDDDGPDLALMPEDRPGDGPEYFTSSPLNLPPDLLPEFDPARIVPTAEGPALELTGAASAQTKRIFAVEIGRVYAVRFAARRTRDAAGPVGDLRFGLRLFDANGASLGSLIMATRSGLTVADSRIAVQALVTRNDPPPAGGVRVDLRTRFAKPFIESVGGAQRTGVEVIRWTDATDATLFSPDVADFAARLDTEVTRATDKDDEHDGLISSLRADLTAANSARSAADTALGARIDTEATRATAAETALSGRVTQLEPYAGPSVGYLDGIVPTSISLDPTGAGLSFGSTSGVRYTLVASGHWIDPIALERDRATNAEAQLGAGTAAEAVRAIAAEVALSGRITVLEPYRGPSVGYVVGAPAVSVELDPSGAALSARSRDGTEYALQTSGAFVDLVGTERARAAAAEKTNADTISGEIARATYADAALSTRLTVLEPYSGPSVGYIAGLLALTITLDAASAALAATTADRTQYVMRSSGVWTNPLQRGSVGPSVGYGTEALPIVAVTVDSAGGALAYDGGDGRRRLAIGPQMWAMPISPEPGPSAGYIDGAPARTITLDTANAGLASAGPDGITRRIDAAGIWRRDFRPISGPSAGYADGQPDSRLVDVTLDASGALLRAQAAGAPERAVEFTAVPGAVARREVAVDVGLLTITGASITVPSVRYRGPNGWAWSKPAVLAVPAPTSVAVSGEVAALRYNDALWTAYQIIRGTLTVTRQSDSAALLEGTDYTADRERGILLGVKNVANFNVSLAYAGYKVRADRIAVDRATGLPSLVLGTETPRSASMLEAALPANTIEIFRSFVSVDDALATRCELTPTHLYDGVIRRDRAATTEAEIARNRRLLRPFRAQAAALRAANATLQWGATGTSRTARVGSGASPAAQNTTPNGPRDRLPYYQLVAADPVTAAKIPSYDKGDGFSPYVEEGWNWEAIKLLRKMGSSVSMLNFAIQGTDSTNTQNGSGYYNQTHPDRLAALTSSAAHIVCWENGTNELGTTFTYANMMLGGTAVLNANKHLVLVGPAMINPRFRDQYAQWRYTCDAMRAVAEDLGVAYVDPRQVFDMPNLGALRMCPREFCEASMQNHDGIREQRAIGALLCGLL